MRILCIAILGKMTCYPFRCLFTHYVDLSQAYTIKIKAITQVLFKQ